MVPIICADVDFLLFLSSGNKPLMYVYCKFIKMYQNRKKSVFSFCPYTL